jgi:probable phosphoglycerate mutase
MSDLLPQIYLARHGETEWSASGRHTGRTDVPLTDAGERNARQLGVRLKGLSFAQVLASPLQRARRTAELAGFGAVLQVDPDLMEWDYGDYEGKRTAEIHQERPGWSLFRDGCPNGETIAAIGARADRVIARLHAVPGNVLLFAHGHILRVLAVRWLGLPVEDGRFLLLGTAALSILGYDHNRDEPVIRLWNDDSHLKMSIQAQ